LVYRLESAESEADRCAAQSGAHARRRTRRLAPHDLRHAARAEAAADYFSAALSILPWESLTIEHGWSSEQYIERMSWAIKRAPLRTPAERSRVEDESKR